MKHFNLAPRLRLNSRVATIKRDEENARWVVAIEGSGPEYFDKVVVATGINSRPHQPKLEGREVFEGEVLHSRAFKRLVYLGWFKVDADGIDPSCSRGKRWLWSAWATRVPIPPRLSLTWPMRFPSRTTTARLL